MFFSPGGTSQNFAKATSISSKAVQYHQNGTGRDTYIKTNHGGFFGNASPRDVQVKEFFNNLRHYENSSITEHKYKHHPELSGKKHL
jgi:hypothetical protein